jgi:hypothetical protein
MSKKNALKCKFALRYNQDALIQNSDHEKSYDGLTRPCLNGK